MSHIVQHGGMVYLAGQVADDPSLDFEGQLRQVLDKIDVLLDEAGSSRSKLLSAMIVLVDMADFPRLNAIWEAWVPGGSAPARATIEAKLANPNNRIEICIVAAL